MKKIGTISLVLGLVALLSFAMVSTAEAGNIPAVDGGLVAITDADFVALWGAPVVANIETAFSFDVGGSTVLSGTVESAVWTGIDVSTTGLFAYTYQIKLTSGDAGREITGIALDLLAGLGSLTPFDFDSSGLADNAFWIVDDPVKGSTGSLDSPLSTVFPGLGSVAPDDANLAGASTGPLKFDFTSPSGLNGNSDPVNSNIFGFASEFPPTITVANMFDSGTEASPTVLTTTPEPTTMLLLGTGLLGLMGVGYRRRRLS